MRTLFFPSRMFPPGIWEAAGVLGEIKFCEWNALSWYLEHRREMEMVFLQRDGGQQILAKVERGGHTPQPLASHQGQKQRWQEQQQLPDFLLVATAVGPKTKKSPGFYSIPSKNFVSTEFPIRYSANLFLLEVLTLVFFSQCSTWYSAPRVRPASLTLLSTPIHMTQLEKNVLYLESNTESSIEEPNP